MTSKQDKPVPRCPLCGYTEADARFHMDHGLCTVRGGSIPGYDGPPATSEKDQNDADGEVRKLAPAEWAMRAAQEAMGACADSMPGTPFKDLQQRVARLISSLAPLDEAVKAIEYAIEAMGAHGPCKNNNCPSCSRTWAMLHHTRDKLRS